MEPTGKPTVHTTVTHSNDIERPDASWNNKKTETPDYKKNLTVEPTSLDTDSKKSITDRNDTIKRITSKKDSQHDFQSTDKPDKKEKSLLESSHSSEKNRKQNPGNCYFINSISKQKLITQVKKAEAPMTTVCIRSSKDLEKNRLMQETCIENGRLQTDVGRLFSDKPLTLIFDF